MKEDLEFTLDAMKWPRTLEEREGRILFCLKSCQIIELTLKQYLGPYTEVLPKRKQPIEDWPLGWLLDGFKRVNNDTELHGLLEEIRKIRNVLAHQALLGLDAEAVQLFGGRALHISDLRDMDRLAERGMVKILGALIQDGMRRRSE